MTNKKIFVDKDTGEEWEAAGLEYHLAGTLPIRKVTPKEKPNAQLAERMREVYMNNISCAPAFQMLLDIVDSKIAKALNDKS